MRDLPPEEQEKIKKANRTKQEVIDEEPEEPEDEFDRAELLNSIRANRKKVKKDSQSRRYDILRLIDQRDNIKAMIHNQYEFRTEQRFKMDELIEFYVDSYNRYLDNSINYRKLDDLSLWVKERSKLLEPVKIEGECCWNYMGSSKFEFDKLDPTHNRYFTTYAVKVANRCQRVAEELVVRTGSKSAGVPFMEYAWTVLEKIRFPDMKENLRRSLTLTQACSLIEQISEIRVDAFGVLTRAPDVIRLRSRRPNLTCDQIVSETERKLDEFGLKLKYRSGVSKESFEDVTAQEAHKLGIINLI